MVAVAAFLAVVVAGCGGDGETGNQADTGAQTDTSSTTATTGTQTAPEPGADAEGATSTLGREVYVQAGCGACHGQNAEGTTIGPALPGHSRDQVRHQVRAPVATMPAYSAAQISDEDLDNLAEYIATLPRPEKHVEPVDLNLNVATHHWLALDALAHENRAEALHHVDHIIEVVTGDQLARMQDVRRLITAGRLHDAEHVVEEMLAGEADPKLTPSQLHLRLALSAVEAGRNANVRHHLGHVRDLSSGATRRTVNQLLSALKAGEQHEVEDGIRRLLGLPHR